MGNVSLMYAVPIVPIFPGPENSTLSTLSQAEKPAVRRSKEDVCGFSAVRE